jgi:hypothetical protein
MRDDHEIIIDSPPSYEEVAELLKRERDAQTAIPINSNEEESTF